ncbi:MAG: hypothetical protein EBZ47_04625, partial [Chlamydiae bacterium]|nr:hypothetical protein [Chlamydiota bacterium]
MKKAVLFCFVYFCFVIAAFQLTVLPCLPEIHGGSGLLAGDAQVFHAEALKLRQNISNYGWQQWSLFPGDHSFIVTLLATLYSIFYPSPLVLLPLNAAAQTLSAYLIYRMGRQIWPGQYGEVGGLIASGVFVLFLSPLVWYGQVHKDTFVLPAVLGILLGYFSLLNSRLTAKAFSKVCWAGVGALLVIFLMRPNYYCLILSAFLGLSHLILAFFYVLRGGLGVLKEMRQAFLFVGMVSALSSFTLALPSSYLRKEFVIQDANAGGPDNDFVWQNSPAIPRWIDQNLKKTSLLRVHFIRHSVSVGAGSGIDLDQKPKNIDEVIAYLPRAMWIGLFAPFPSQWLEKMSAIRLVSSVETFLWYLFFPGVVYLALRKPSPALWAGALFCLGMITLFSYVNPNLGTLYRVRFGFWFFFLICGAVGWMGALLPLMQSAGKNPKSPQIAGPPGKRRRISHLDEQILSRFFSVGSVALVLTWAGFLGFFLRDLILVRL